MKRHLLIAALILTLIPLISCAGSRVPSTKTAHNVTKSFFKRYGKKYKDSLFGRIPIEKIEINRVQEQSLHHAEVEAFLNLKGGEVARVLITAKNTPPFGWSVLSWEMVDLR